MIAVPLTLTLALLDSCGSNPAHQLQSITVTPETVSSTAGGTVQFVATGHYNSQPYTVTPLQVESPLHQGWSYTSPQDVKLTISQDGIASCESVKGTFVVAAWAASSGPVCNVVGPGGAPCPSIAGTAQLTCP
jgi:hypothetical protein